MTDPIATLTLQVAYFAASPGQHTGVVEVAAIGTSIDLGSHLLRNAIRVWDGESKRAGAELHACVIAAAEMILEPWTDEAERLHRLASGCQNDKVPGSEIPRRSGPATRRELAALAERVGALRRHLLVGEHLHSEGHAGAAAEYIRGAAPGLSEVFDALESMARVHGDGE